ncbi:MAG TPA: TonB-dependent receptor [Bryobacteraceae bacterium]|nr:TonB-dependent receptor [Bryobacteraceae bacterium]
MTAPRCPSALLVFAFACSLYGQAVNGSLLGSVTDASGAVIPGAHVTILEVNTGVIRNATTSGSGNYVFPDLAPGTYTVTVVQQGFKKVTRERVDVVVNSSVRVDLVLPLGDVNEMVTVAANAPLLQTDRADTGRKIETVQVETMPLGTNRNFQNLISLVPGATRAFNAHSQFFNAVQSLQTEVNGQPRMGNNLQLEGIDDNERTGLLQMIIPPIEAIQTVDVSTSNFEAELGRATGAVTNVILKSGTNQLHGEAYEFFKNNALNARNFFDPSIAHLAYNYFGGNIGGPIIKNKLFIFGDYLKVLDHESNVNLESIPTPDFRTGNLATSSTVIYNPFTGNPDGASRIPFPNNQIPASMINPISTKILGLIPQPNAAGVTNNYFATLPFRKDIDSFDVKSDYDPSDNDRISGRFSFDRPVTYQAPLYGLAGGPAQSAFEASGVQNTYSSGINYTHIFSASLIAEFRIGAAHYRNSAQNSDYGTTASTALGIPGVNLDAFTSGLTSVNIGGYSSPVVGYSINLPWIRSEANIDVVNNWTKTFGSHTLKWGGDLRRIRDDLLAMITYGPRGTFTFSDGQTSIPGAKTSFANDFASFLLDVPNLVGRDLPTYFPAYRAWQLFTFVQDKWAVTPKLTIDLGVRWEYYPPGTPRFSGGFSNYDPTTNSLVVAGIGNNPKDLGMRTSYKNFAPRFGLAYRLTSSTVIRSGFGVSYTPFPDNTYAYNFPVNQNNTFNPLVAGFGPALLPNGQIATFQAGFPPPTPAVVPSNGIIANAPNQVYQVVNLRFKQPYVESWNFAIQQALPKHFTMDVAYVGNHGVDIGSNVNLNAATVLGLGVNGQPLYAAFGRTANTNMVFQGFSSNYNALQVKIDRRFSSGLLITTAYTWSKAMGYQTSDDGGLLYYVYGYGRRNYAPLDFNHTQSFVQSYVYQLPFGKGKRWVNSGPASLVAGGWQVSGILSLITGSPLNITYSATGLQAPGNTQSPDLIAPVQILHGIGVSNPWFSPSSFAPPAALTFGNLGRNAISGPGLFNLDFSLFRTIDLSERLHLQLRGEAFSITNTPQFANPGLVLGNANFGYITGTSGGGRVMQLGVKLSF